MLNNLKLCWVTSLGAVLAATFCAQAAAPTTEAAIVFETRAFEYVIGNDGSNRQFIDKRTGSNHYRAVTTSYFATINKQGHQYPGTITGYREGKLSLQFGNSGSSALIAVETRDDYMTFEVLQLSDTTGITDLSLLNLDLNLKAEPGEPFAASAVDLNIHTFNSTIPGYNNRLHVYCNPKDGFPGAKVAVVGCPGEELQSTLKQVIRDNPNLPQTKLGGPWATDAPITRGSYLIEMGRLNETNVSAWINMARNIGARQIDLHCGKTLRFGDLEPDRKTYPAGFDGVRQVIGKLHAAGLAVGLHTYAFYLSKESKWVSPVPDPRLGKHKLFSLAEALDETSGTIPVEESTRDMSTITGFLIPNSTTLQVDEELIVFSAVETNPPYAFTKCTRGAWGTKAAAHAKAAKVSQLREMFGLFSPDGDSTLFDEIARRTADVFNDCGFDMIYLDAIDGAGALAGRHTPAYYQAKFIFELNRHLKKPALMEMSAFDSHFWFARSRMGAWDVPSKAYKMFVKRHYLDNQYYAKSFLPRNIGWWAIWDWTPKERIRMFPEDIEYILCKSLASGDSLSWIESFSPESFAQSPSQQRFATLIKQYEDLRLADYFPASTRNRVGQANQDFTLEQTTPGEWHLRPLSFDKHEVTGIDGKSNMWHTHNPYGEQPVKLRIEAGLSLAPYDDANGQVVEDFANPSAFGDKRSSAGVAFALGSASTPAKSGSGSGFLQATNSQAQAPDAWSMITRQFTSRVDFSQHGFGVWVHGDGNGEVLNFMWKAPANICMGIDEHYVVVDFTGWKYFEFIEPESDRVGLYHWPHHPPSGAPYVETAWVDYTHITSLTIGCLNIPQGKPVSCYFSPIKRLPHVSAKLLSPSITIRGKRLIFPVELESGQYLDFRSPTNCKVYGRQGEVVRAVQPEGDVPVLGEGQNPILFDCGADSPVNVRAKLTVITQDHRAFGR